jgi:hypothetical protein
MRISFSPESLRHIKRSEALLLAHGSDCPVFDAWGLIIDDSRKAFEAARKASIAEAQRVRDAWDAYDDRCDEAEARANYKYC